MIMISENNKNVLLFRDFIENKKLVLDTIISLNNELVERYKNFEPIEKISTNEIQDIHDVILRSDNKNFGIYNYESLNLKFAFIFYTIIKHHYLVNGNKRTAAQIFMFLLSVTDIKLNNPESLFSKCS